MVVAHAHFVRVAAFAGNGPLHTRRIMKRLYTARHDDITTNIIFYHKLYMYLVLCKVDQRCWVTDVWIGLILAIEWDCKWVNTLYVVSMWILIDYSTVVSICVPYL